MTDCLFCKITAGDIPSQRVYEDDSVVAFLDIRPTNFGHTLVVPKEHSEDILSTTEQLAAHMMSVAKKLAPAIIKASGAEGFNLILNTKPAAGQVIFHTHMHIIPRHSDDGFSHWPGKHVSGDELDSMAEKIKKLF
jgi:histidine triad (HIT) family protein